MVTSIYTADVKLNKGKKAKPCIIIHNQEGILIVEEGLFSIAFDDTISLKESNVTVTNKKHITDITL